VLGAQHAAPRPGSVCSHSGSTSLSLTLSFVIVRLSRLVACCEREEDRRAPLSEWGGSESRDEACSRFLLMNGMVLFVAGLECFAMGFVGMKFPLIYIALGLYVCICWQLGSLFRASSIVKASGLAKGGFHDLKCSRGVNVWSLLWWRARALAPHYCKSPANCCT
jgi:hypothetical protein